MDVKIFTDQILLNMAQFDYTKKETSQAGLFNPAVPFWSREVQEWLHRQPMWIWVSGAVPEDLNESRPVVLDWSTEDLKSKDQAKWPPSNTALSDLVVYKIISAGVSHRDRHRRWPVQEMSHRDSNA